MERVWTPWRMPYILGIKESTGCVFCEEVLTDGVEPDLVIHRGRHAFVLLNLYPYAVGHLMIVPYRHVARLRDLAAEESDELTGLLQAAERTVEQAMRASHSQVGINIGRCAGAGVEGHLHIHLVPLDHRQEKEGSDLPPAELLEPLVQTRDRLRRAWNRIDRRPDEPEPLG